MKILAFLFCITIGLLLPLSAHAAAPRSSIEALYTISSDTETQTKVEYTIELEEASSAIATDEYTLNIPTSFPVTSVTATVDSDAVQAVLASQQNLLSVSVPFPQTDKRDSRSITLSFLQTNIVRRSGDHTEVLIPTLISRQNEEIRYRLRIPSHIANTVVSSRPMFASRDRDEIVWNNPRGKTIQVLLGSAQQLYSLALRYELQNDSSIAQTSTVVLPPETPYQLLHAVRLSERPVSLTFDADGNPIASFSILPRGKKVVEYHAAVELRLLPDEQRKQYERAAFASMKPHLLRPYIGDEHRTPKLSDSRAVYEYTVASLSYDYSQLNLRKLRTNHKTAAEILSSPTRSICLDYSSLFVHLSRKNGGEAREVFGYAINQNEQLRPTQGDELHSWAQYYDTAVQEWIDIDPTWEDTSSLDYYHFHDFNHLTLTYRGAQESKPYPAGFYRFTGNTQAQLITVHPIDSLPAPRSSIVLNTDSLKKTYNDRERSSTSLTIENRGDSVLYDLPLFVTSPQVNIAVRPSRIPVIYPYQSRSVQLTVQPNGRAIGATTMLVSVGEVSRELRITVLPQSYTKTFVISGSVLGLLLLVWLIGRKRNS